MKVVQTTDASVIARLNEQVQNLHHHLYPTRFKPFNFDDIKAYFHAIIDSKNHYFFICMEKNEPIGYIWFEEVKRSETAFSNAMHYLYVNHISVNKNFRKKGVGSALFDTALYFAQSNGIKKIGLDYWSKNSIAKEIYEKIGFEVEREISFLTVESE